MPAQILDVKPQNTFPFDVTTGHSPKLPQPRLLDSRPDTPIPGPIEPPDGFSEEFTVAAARFARALRIVQSKYRAMEGERSQSRLFRPAFRRASIRHTRARDRYLAASQVLAGMIRSLTDQERVANTEWASGNPLFAETWASVEWGGAVYSLDHSGHMVNVRPAQLAVRLSAPDRSSSLPN